MIEDSRIKNGRSKRQNMKERTSVSEEEINTFDYILDTIFVYFDQQERH